jgi:hypothetical protein
MKLVRSSALLPIVMTAALAVAGCSSEASPTAPSLPAAATGAAFGTESTSAISGQLVGGGGDGLAASAAGAAAGVAATSGLQVSIPGTNLSAAADSAGRFLLTGVPNGNIVLHIAGNGSDADLMLQGIAADQLVQITIQLQGSTAAVVAEEREELEEFEGTVVALDPAALGLTLDDGTAIVTDESTWWDTGGDLLSYAELADAFGDGLPIGVEGHLVMTPEGLLLATVIKAEAGEADGEPAIDELRLAFNRDEWSLGWIGSGSPGNGNSAVVAQIDHGPYADILGSSIEMEGPDGIVVPFATGIEGSDFEARFTQAQAIGVAAGVPADSDVEIFVRGTLIDGTAWELSSIVRITADDDDGDDADDDGDDDDGGELLDPDVAAQAIIDVNVVIADIDTLVGLGELAANNAHPLISKLEAAIGSLQRLNGGAAANQLEAFLHQLDAFAKTGKIAADAAADLETSVELILDGIDD